MCYYMLLMYNPGQTFLGMAWEAWGIWLSDSIQKPSHEILWCFTVSFEKYTCSSFAYDNLSQVLLENRTGEPTEF